MKIGICKQNSRPSNQFSHRIRFQFAFLLLGLSSLILNIGCQQEGHSTSPNTSFETVTFETEDQIRLSGRIFGPVQGNPVILLTHSTNETQDSWNPFVDLLLKQDYTVMTFNFRGTEPSQGNEDEIQFAIDIKGALSFLRSQGVRGVIIIGSGEGATAGIHFASTQRVLGIIALSPHLNLGELNTSSILSGIDNPILFIVSEGDESGHQVAAEMFHSAHRGVWAISIFRGNANGAALVTSQENQEVSEHVLQYLEDFLQ